MISKSEYRKKNIEFLKQKSREEGVGKLQGGVLYEVLESGEGGKTPNPGSVVLVYYKGTLIDGTEFDSNLSDGCPMPMRLRDLIEGWQIALIKMSKGDKWRIYVPATLGYGSRRVDNIPGESTLVFDIELTGFQ